MFIVNWDNGNGACGTFPNRFETEEEAEAFALEWEFEMNAEEGLVVVGGEGCYVAEVVEVEFLAVDPEAAPDNPRPRWA